MLIGDAGDVFFVFGVAENEAVLPAVLVEPGGGDGTDNVHGKTCLVLAVAWQGHGFQCFMVGIPIAQALLLVFLGALVQDAGLLVLGAVAAVEPAFNAGGTAVQNHLPQALLRHLCHPGPFPVAHQVGLPVFRHGIAVVHQKDIDACGGEEAGLPIDDCGRNRHGAVLQEIILVFVLLEPAGVHDPVLFKVEGILTDLLPAGLHHAVLAEEIAPVLHIHKTLGHQAAALIEIVGAALQGGEPSDRGAGFIQIVAALALLQPAGGQGALVGEEAPHPVQLLPAGGKSTIGKEVAVFSVHIFPALGHGAVLTEIAPLAINLLPAGAHHTVAAEIVAAAADVLPAGDHGAVEAKIIQAAIVLQPAGNRLAFFIQIIIVSVLLHPAAAVHVLCVVPQQPQGSHNKDHGQGEHQNQCTVS